MKNSIIKKLLIFLKLCALGALIGALGGAVGAVFAHLLSFVTGVRAASPWLILLLPLSGILTVILYRVCRMGDHGGTNEIIHCLTNKSPIRVIAAPLIFVSTVITHLFGGSAGREGAAIQLGGAGASAVANVLRLKEDDRSVFIMSGMSAVFAGVFGTPLTAAFFILEFKLTAKIRALAAVPCFASAVIAAKVSSLMGTEGESLLLNYTNACELKTIAKIAVLAVGLSLLGRVMCFFFHNAGIWTKKLVSNPFLRSALAAIVFVLLTAAVGDMRYSGSGMSMALGAVEGEAAWFDFILKLVFTSVTLAAGFKGGEIVPTFCIGATFGCVFGGVLGLDAGFAAALGFVGLFSCATNSPISAVFLGIEMFGTSALPYFILVCLLLLPLSVRKGLFVKRFFAPEFNLKKISDEK